MNTIPPHVHEPSMPLRRVWRGGVLLSGGLLAQRVAGASEFDPGLLPPVAHLDPWLAAAVASGLIGLVVGGLALAQRRYYRKRRDAELQTMRSTRALLANEEKYRALVELSSDGIFIETVRGEILDCNQAALTMFGYSREEMIGLTIADLVPAEFAALIPPVITDAMTTGDIPQERQNRRKDGTIFPTEINTKIIEIDGEPRLIATIRDITRRKEAERAIRESQRTLATLMSNLPGMVFRCRNDRQWTMEFVSQGCLPLTGYSSEALNNNAEVAFIDLIHPEDRERVERVVRAGLTGDQPYRVEYRIVTRGGEERWVCEQGRGIYREDRDEQLIEGYIADQTQQRQAEEAHTRLEKQLRQAAKMEAVGQLAGGVAHDFNNLLQVIGGYTDLALVDLPEEDRRRHALEQIQTAAGRATDLVRQLLTFSRLQKIQPCALSLNTVVAGIIEMIQRLIGGRIELSFEPAAALDPILADRSQIEQIVFNLCVNARDAIEGPGHIRIATRHDRLTEKFCRMHPWSRVGDFAVLSVSDDGAGIAPEHQDHIFEPFFSTKEIGQGTGLGLATVYGIVRQHNGLIRLITAPGEGSTFEIFLPFDAHPPAGGPVRVENHEHDSVRAVPGAAARKTILLAEDEALVQRLMVRILSDAGYEVLAADDGAQALDLLEAHAHRIQLVLLDGIMPHVNGRGVFEKMRERNWRIPVLFSSGYSRELLDLPAEWDGYDVLKKPITSVELLDRVRALLEEPVQSGG